MRFVVVFFTAYLLTAVFYAWRDMVEPSVIRQVGYIRNYRRDHRLLSLILSSLLGLPASLHCLYIDSLALRYHRREWRTVAFFLVALAVIWRATN